MGGRLVGAGARRARWGWSAAVLVALGVGVVAGRATFVPPEQGDEPAPVQTYTVAVASVGTTATYPVSVRWPVTPLASGAGAGTVTRVAVKPGQQVAQGDVLYDLDLHPVVIARGAVPAFRDLGAGARGEDVRQLQQLLADMGHLSGAVTDRFDRRTGAAVRAWQAALGVERTGVVRAGDVVFAANLPAKVVLADAVVVGAVLSPGVSVVSAAADAPKFTLLAGGGQNATVPVTGTAVTVVADQEIFAATVADSETDPAGGVLLHLQGADGGSVCADRCQTVPFTTGELRFPAQVVLQPEVTGPAVPIAAVGTAADGTRFVVTPAGERVPVTVTAADASRAVLDGVEAGDVVQLFATAPPDPADAADPAPTPAATPGGGPSPGSETPTGEATGGPSS